MSDEPAPTRIGDYEIEGVLGEGGMAKVYRARHAILETVHAIKVLDPSYRANPEARSRFLDEAKIQAKHLDHENIVKVTNIVATADHAALVMELVEGPGLEGKLAELKSQPAELKRIMLGVLDAVGYAHAAGIIHRDLKPANVLLARKGGILIPKVTDFGIAKVLAAEPGKGGKKSTHGGARMGTLSYSSPEQIRRAKDVTARSDVFSLGVMLYEMATGEMAFGGDSDYDVMENIVNGRYEPPERRFDKIDPVIAAVIQRAMKTDPAARFASCAEMAAALRGEVSLPPLEIAAQITAQERASQRITAAVPPPSSKLGLVLGLVVAAAALGGVAVYLATRHDSDAPKPPSADAGGRVATVAPDASAPPATKPDPWAGGSGSAVWNLEDREFPANFEQPPSFAETTASGLRYLLLKRTSADVANTHPTSDDSVTVNYKMWRVRNHELLSSNIGRPPEFYVLSMTQPGLQEAFRLMSPGDTTRFWIPAKLTSERGEAWLADVELISITTSCSGTFASGDDLRITYHPQVGSCGSYAFVDTSATGKQPRCDGELSCDTTSTARFVCTYKGMTPTFRLTGTMAFHCTGKDLEAKIVTASGTKVWTLSPDNRPRP